MKLFESTYIVAMASRNYYRVKKLYNNDLCYKISRP